MSDDLEPEEADASWRHIIAISTLVFALIVIGGAVYIHLKDRQRIDFELELERNKIKQYLDASAAAATSDPDVSASTSKEDESEYNDSYSKDSANKNGDYAEDFEEDFAGNITIRLTNVNADSEESASDSAEAIDAGTDFRTSLQKQEQLQQELVRCYEANYKSQSLPTAANSSIQQSVPPLLTELCLQCICETATECRSVECAGAGVACGIFRISYNYWIDAGRPRLQGVDDSKNMTESEVYSQCVSNTFCAARAVVTNVNKYARDCNQDGTIDCLDHAELHILGPHGCLRDEMPAIFAMRLNRCLAKFS